MHVYTEKAGKFRVCGIKAALGRHSRAEIVSDFLGNDSGARFECLLGCGRGHYGILKREDKSSDPCEKIYLYGKSIYPTVYLPAGGTQWTLPAATYLKAKFSEKEARALTVEGAWKFLEDIYIPSSRYLRDPDNPFDIEFYHTADSSQGFQLWMPVIMR